MRKRPPYRLKRSHLFAALFLAAIVLWVGSGVVTRPERAAPPAATRPEATVPTVRVRASQARERPDLLIVQGRTAADRTVTLKAEIAGRVIAIGARRGATVAAGEMIARLDPGDRQSRLAEARARVALRQLEWDAARQLGERAFASRTRVAEARARLEEAEAQLAAIREELDDTQIRAPFDGVLEDRMVEVGDYVSDGDPVARVVDPDPLNVLAEVPETAAGQLHPGLPAQAVLADGRRIEGVITYVGSVAREETRTFRIEMEAEDGQGIAAGLTAELRVRRPGEPAHLAPASALTLDDEGRLGLKTVDDQSVVRFHPVRVLGEGGDGFWVTGLPDPARIIVLGQEWVRAGQTVAAVPDDGGGV